MTQYHLIDPQEVLDFSNDWSTFLAEAGSPSDVITTSSWDILPSDGGSPTGPTLTGSQTVGDVTTVFLSETVLFQVYRLTNRITTAQGRTADRSWDIRCHSR